MPTAPPSTAARTVDFVALAGTIATFLPLAGGVFLALRATAIDLPVSPILSRLSVEELAYTGLLGAWWAVPAIGFLWLWAPKIVASRSALVEFWAATGSALVGLYLGLMGMVALLSIGVHLLPEVPEPWQEMVVIGAVAAVTPTLSSGAANGFVRLTAASGPGNRETSRRRRVGRILRPATPRRWSAGELLLAVLFWGLVLASVVPEVESAGGLVFGLGALSLLLMVRSRVARISGELIAAKVAEAEARDQAEDDSVATPDPDAGADRSANRAQGDLKAVVSIVAVVVFTVAIAFVPPAVGLGILVFAGALLFGAHLVDDEELPRTFAIRLTGIASVAALALATQARPVSLLAVKPQSGEPDTVQALFIATSGRLLTVTCRYGERPSWSDMAADESVTIGPRQATLPKPPVSLLTATGLGGDWQPRVTRGLSSVYGYRAHSADGICHQPASEQVIAALTDVRGWRDVVTTKTGRAARWLIAHRPVRDRSRPAGRFGAGSS